MLLGAHVSTAGGLVAAYERGVECECDAIQIFHQSPRMWKPVAHREEDIAEFRSRLDSGPVRAVVIHAVYLINCASKDPEIRSKSITSLVHALRLGDAIGAGGVVLHPGSQVKQDYGESMELVGQALREALAESERCPLLLENTAGAGGTLGRSFEELARLVELAGGDERIGLCFDCCHMLASGFDIRDDARLARVIDDCSAVVGLDRLRCLHVNDSMVPLGANRDRHAVIGEGELGAGGISSFLSEPRFEGLPALIETGMAEGSVTAEDLRLARKLRKRGIQRRRRRAAA